MFEPTTMSHSSSGVSWEALKEGPYPPAIDTRTSTVSPAIDDVLTIAATARSELTSTWKAASCPFVPPASCARRSTRSPSTSTAATFQPFAANSSRNPPADAATGAGYDDGLCHVCLLSRDRSDCTLEP